MEVRIMQANSFAKTVNFKSLFNIVNLLLDIILNLPFVPTCFT